jgi:hypothetical protein
MTISAAIGLTGLVLSTYAVIANDSAQTLGTFISSNKDTSWWKSWLYMSLIMILTLGYAWLIGDITYGRLNEIPFPLSFKWYHGVAPVLLLVLTHFGIPVSTTLLTLSLFSSSLVLKKIIIKSAIGYGIAAVSAYILWFVLSYFLNEKRPVKIGHKKYWVIGQWMATGFLWSQWLSHDIANVAVYLPRKNALTPLMFLGFITLLIGWLAYLFYTKGGKIQSIIQSKSGTRFARSATIIDFVYAIILWVFKEYNNLPMSTTWVFVGLLCGRELAVYRVFSNGAGIKMIFPILINDFFKMMAGLALSVILVGFIITFG